jgi:3-oxoadipate enol-lactonase
MSMVRVNGTELYVQDVGPRDAPALVFCHSLFFNADMFASQVQRFADEYRVVTYDNRGQGRSAPAPLEQLDMDTLTDDAAALIEVLDLGPCHFLGNSMGGFVALRLAARRPELLRSAVAMGSSGDAEGKQAEFGPLVEHMQQHGTAEVIDTLMYIMFGDTSLGQPGRPDLTVPWREYMLGLDRSIGDAAHAVVYRSPVREELATTSLPVLAITGTEDHAYEVPLSRAIAATAPNGRCVVIEAAGHSVALEQPDLVNQQLAEHFSRVDVTAAAGSAS